MAMQGTSGRPAAVPEVERLVESAGASGETDGYAGKRASLRIKDGRQLEATTNTNNPGAAWPVAMHNVSDSGFAFWSKRRPPRGVIYIREFSAVEQRPWVQARVTHITRGLRGFLVGACFE